MEDLYAHLNGIRVLGSGGDGLVLHLLVALIAASLFLVVFEGFHDGLKLVLLSVGGNLAFLVLEVALDFP